MVKEFCIDTVSLDEPLTANYSHRLAKSLTSYAGERFDFVVNANRSIGNYWIRARGRMDCDERFTKAHQVAILRYEGAIEEDPEGKVSYTWESKYDSPSGKVRMYPYFSCVENTNDIRTERPTAHNDDALTCPLSFTAGECFKRRY